MCIQQTSSQAFRAYWSLEAPPWSPSRASVLALQQGKMLETWQCPILAPRSIQEPPAPDAQLHLDSAVARALPRTGQQLAAQQPASQVGAAALHMKVQQAAAATSRVQRALFQ